MRGNQDEQEEVFSYIPLKKRGPQDHPLRRGREMTDRALQELLPRFDQLYGQTGRPSIPPEQRLRAQIPIAGMFKKHSRTANPRVRYANNEHESTWWRIAARKSKFFRNLSSRAARSRN